jgi:hypothetical protein
LSHIVILCNSAPVKVRLPGGESPPAEGVTSSTE